jgi:MFS family permease
VVLFLLWGVWELRTHSPLVDLRVSARPTVLWTNAGSIAIGFAMFAGFLVTTQILQAPQATGYGFGLSLVTAGLVLLPIGGAMTIFSPVSARVSRWRGARTTLVLGTSVLAVGNVLMAVLPDSVPQVIAASTTMAIGAALAYSAIPLLIMQAVPPTETAAANSLNTVMRMLGTSSCSAFVAAVATASTSVIGGQALPSATAYTVIYLAAAGAAVIGAVIAAFIPPAARRVENEAVVPLPARAA